MSNHSVIWCLPLLKPNQYMSLDGAYLKKEKKKIYIYERNFNESQISHFWHFASYDTAEPEQGYI